MTEKKLDEEELMGLEREIDAAVDRLFVEKLNPDKKAAGNIFELQPVHTDVEWSGEAEEFSDLIGNLAPEQEGFISSGMEGDGEPVAAAPDPIEKLESQLLSLEWEISKDNLVKTAKEVQALQGSLKESPEISSILNRMVSILNHMVRNEAGIQPQLIHFLIDSKDTIKLLMRKEPDRDVLTYQKLAYAGIEGRFSSLLGAQESRPLTPAPAASQGSDLIEAIDRRMASFSRKMDEMAQKMYTHLSAHQRLAPLSEAHSIEESPLKTKVTLFKKGETVLGVESDKVFKLFKVPDSLSEEMARYRKVRLNGLDTKMVDLKSLVPVSGESREGGERVLILKGEGEYKGLRVDRVLNRLSGPLETGGEFSEYLLGMIRWTYRDLPIRVPVLDVGKV